MNNIENIILNYEKNNIELSELIKTISNRKIVLFGAGRMSKHVVKTLNNYGLTLSCFCDNSEKKVGTVIEGLPVIGFEELCTFHKDSYIYITSSFYYVEIVNQLIQHGFNEENICHYDLVHFFPWEEGYIDCLKENVEKFNKLEKILADDKSREVLYGRLNFLISRKRKFVTDIRTSMQYFERELIKLGDEEIYADLGAYDGDSISAFIIACNNKYKKIYAIEPEETLFKKLSESYQSMENIELIHAGAWNLNDCITYNTICEDFAVTLSDNSMNFDNKDNLQRMYTRTFDSILSGKPVTFIKMDIVGVEKEALEGAINSIKTYKPKLAVCVYHKANDIFSLPFYILDIYPEYDIYLRHYSDGVSETVCYALPRKDL